MKHKLSQKFEMKATSLSRCESDSGSTQCIDLDWSAIIRRQTFDMYNSKPVGFPVNQPVSCENPEDFVQSANVPRRSSKLVVSVYQN